MHWFDVLPGVSGAELLTTAHLRAWPDQAFGDRLHNLAFCPIVIAELYLVARHLPLLIVDYGSGPMVMADLRGETLIRPAFDSKGKYLRSHRPYSLRVLPFVADADGGIMRLVDPESDAGPERSDGLRHQLMQILQGHAAGYKQLQAAARTLISRGLVASSDNEGREWLPAPQTTDRGPSSDQEDRAMPSSVNEFLALRLLALLEFSALHRRDASQRATVLDSHWNLIGRNDILRRRKFLMKEDLIDFSGIRAHRQDSDE